MSAIYSNPTERIPTDKNIPLPSQPPVESSLNIQRVPFAERARKEGSLAALSLFVLLLSFFGPCLKSKKIWIDIPCLFRKFTRLPCLACGLTRSFIFTAQGDFRHAFKTHLLGPPLFFTLIILFFYFIFSVASGYRLTITLSAPARKKIFALSLWIAVFAWAYKLVFSRGYW